MARVIIDRRGDKFYYNDDNDRHREDGPAAIGKDGWKEYWWKDQFGDNYVFNSPDSAANGRKSWLSARCYHSVNRPAIDCPNGHKEWMMLDNPIWPEL